MSLVGHVRKGETGTTVVYADRFVPDDERRRAGEYGDEPHAFPFLKRFTVFNVEQREGLPAEPAVERPALPADMILPQVKELIRNSGPHVRIGGDEAHDAPTHDFIQVPQPSSFAEPIDWHRTALHHPIDRQVISQLVCFERAYGRCEHCWRSYGE